MTALFLGGILGGWLFPAAMRRIARPEPGEYAPYTTAVRLLDGCPVVGPAIESAIGESSGLSRVGQCAPVLGTLVDHPRAQRRPSTSRAATSRRPVGGPRAGRPGVGVVAAQPPEQSRSLYRNIRFFIAFRKPTIPRKQSVQNPATRLPFEPDAAGQLGAMMPQESHRSRCSARLQGTSR
jgi:hypothetical protein